MKTTMFFTLLIIMSACSSEKKSDDAAPAVEEQKTSKKTQASKAMNEEEMFIRGAKFDYKDEYSNVGTLWYVQDEANVKVCTATLITKDIAITSAHCVEDVVNHPDRTIYYKFSNSKSVHTQKPEDLISISQIRYLLQPADTSPTAEKVARDVALIKLAKVVENYDPEGVRLFAKEDEDPKLSLAVDTAVTTVGYGVISDTDKNWKRKVAQIAYFDQSESGPLYFKPESAEQLKCQGDSGSPVIVNNIVFGVLSKGDGEECSHKSIAPYTHLLARYKWIKRNVSELNRWCLPTLDHDKDGDADGASFLAWQRAVGQKNIVPGTSLDVDCDGDVDGDDLKIFQEFYGD
jgi:hypothetical protein